MSKWILLLGAVALTGLAGCGGDDDSDGGVSIVPESCEEIVNCIDGADNEVEENRCFEDASASAQADFEALTTCILESGCEADDSECLAQACAAEIAACG